VPTVEYCISLVLCYCTEQEEVLLTARSKLPKSQSSRQRLSNGNPLPNLPIQPERKSDSKHENLECSEDEQEDGGEQPETEIKQSPTKLKGGRGKAVTPALR